MTEHFEADSDYELFMPFIVVESQGGPFPDEPFVVGYELGLLDQELQTLANVGPGRAVPIGRYVHTQGLPQVDLIAMRNGYTIDTSEGHSDATWTWIDLKPETPDGG